MSSITTYDDVVYGTRPRMVTHPDTLSVVATLMGLKPAPVGKARVLELGCGTGGNLTPMAALLPEARFLGTDLSPVQIAEAEGMVRKLGLTNIEYRAESITDWDASIGEFDYIICHGVYSWVPAFVREKILAVCSKHLTPNGIAYISYNTLPGWHLRTPVREMLNYHVKDAPDAAARIQGARGLLQFLAIAVPESAKTYGVVIKEEVAGWVEEPDYYLFHEHLESDNTPFYFHQFMAAAQAAGLQFVGEAGPVPRLDDLPTNVREAIEEHCADLLQVEQYLDFLHGRRFRRTLLCRAGVPMERALTPSVLDSMYVSGAAKPESDEPNMAPGIVESFEAPGGKKAKTGSTLFKAVVTKLWRELPALIAVPDLTAQIAEQFSASPEAVRGPMTQMLVEGYLSGMLTLHTQPPAFVVQPSEKPLGFPIAQIHCAERGIVPSARHQEVRLEPFDRHILGLLDGTRDIEALTALVDSAIAAGTISALEGPTPAVVDEALVRLGRSAVLVG